MTDKMKLIAIFVFFTLLVVACNLPKGSQPVEPTSSTETFVQVVSTESAEEALNREVPPPANTDGAETVFVPGAVFWMGSRDTDEDAGEDEMPFHQVTQSGFYIYTHEVTNAMYAACVEDRACLPVRVYESGPTTHYGDPEFAD